MERRGARKLESRSKRGMIYGGFDRGGWAEAGTELWEVP